MDNATQEKPQENRTIPCTDEVLLECWRIKDELSAKYGHDLDKLFADVREHQKQSELAGHRVVDLSGERKKQVNGGAK
jgi:hypothetical protein